MRICVFGLVALSAALCGCEQQDQAGLDRPEINEWMINAVNDIAIRNGIIRQHTLFGYHFVADGAELNALGMRDLDVLAKHFRQHPGQLNVRQGSAGTDLYEARIRNVAIELTKAGVDTERVQIKDLPAGGDGMPSEQVLLILGGEKKAPAAARGNQGGRAAAGEE